MLITVQRTGGFSAIPLSKTLDTSKLPSLQAQEIHQMITSTNFFSLPAQITPSNQPDRFSYKFTIKTEQKEHTTIISETAIPSTLKPLLPKLGF